MNFTTKKQTNQNNFQNLDAIPGIKEVSNEAASFCSGGQITFYDKEQKETLGTFSFGGKRSLISDDKISSINITDNSEWRLFADPNYGGYAQTFKKGKTTLPPELNNKVSSFIRVA
jgi:hypothetical protein